MISVSMVVKGILDNLLDDEDDRQKAGRMTLGEMTEHLKATGKYICGVNGLPCSFCKLYCEHRKERDDGET